MKKLKYEWASDCCLMPTQQFFSYMMARIQEFDSNR